VPALANGQAAETVGVITEMKPGRGRVELKPSGAPDWRAAGPLQALRPGDAIRASGDAWAVILLSGGRGNVKVDAAASPYVVPAPRPGESKLQKALGLVEATVKYLSSGPKEPPQAILSSRGEPKPPVVLSPRNGPVLPESLAFDWLGSRYQRYAIKIVGPAGVVLERAGVSGARFEYPPDAPALTPGTRYTFQVALGGKPPEEAAFEVFDPGRTQAIRRNLAELEQSLGPSPSPNTLAALRAGFLASQGLLHDARLVLLAALQKDADEPALHQLLGDLYEKTGLSVQAAEEYDEARFLVAPAAAPPGR
jgi:hypothetical protein